MDVLAAFLKDLAESQIEGDRELLKLINKLIDKQVELESVVTGLLKTVTIHSEILRIMIEKAKQKESVH